jgi:DNA-binding transcriptional LysR family regulator
MRFHAAAIYYFDAVRRAGSIRAAARNLNVASSAVNRQILKLEEEIGSPLFERTPGGLKLTVVGELLARHVLSVLQDHERFTSDVQGLAGGRLGTARIAAVDALSETVLPTAIRRTWTRSPGVDFHVLSMGSAGVSNALAKGDADVGIAFAVRYARDVRQVELIRFRLGAIVAINNPLSRRRCVSMSACVESGLILALPNVSVNQLLQPLLARLPSIPPAVVQSSSIELMRELAEREVGISFQTRIGAERLLNSGRVAFVPLDSAGPVWADLGIYVRDGRALPNYLNLFIQDLARELREHEAKETALFE